MELIQNAVELGPQPRVDRLAQLHRLYRFFQTAGRR